VKDTGGLIQRFIAVHPFNETWPVIARAGLILHPETPNETATAQLAQNNIAGFYLVMGAALSADGVNSLRCFDWLPDVVFGQRAIWRALRR
jgi:hypothetical protein